MEKIKTEGAAPAADKEEVKVVIMGDGPVPEALRKAFPNAEFVDTSAPAPGEEEAPLELLAEIGETLAKLREATRPGCGCYKAVMPAREHPTEADGDHHRAVVYAKLKGIAHEYGLDFDEKELEALYHLSAAFSPSLAVSTAHAACRSYVAAWGG